ncbi:hypothetical protein QWY86_16240 [Pedobacter aquatilis]|uniref:hypothetical protein n=1 Tax=Pedobacter aquatilis TaxID=351343 RepID=UPI0025B59E7C|nr:hypothetical protein [Pedobacter aquatilis]MDN3588234.1 hypothetical protein [Pedobacter aquatilis]
MSTYFQYPSTIDSANLMQNVKYSEVKFINNDDEYTLIMEEMIELKDFLNLKPV